MRTIIAFAMLGAYASAKMTDATWFYNTDRPMVVGHRGSQGHFPEHSKAGYQDAFFNGADWVELDLQVTKDGHIIAFHDPCLKHATNVESYAWKWADREGDFYFPASNHTCEDDYLVHDFTLAELKSLRLKQRMDYRTHDLDDYFQVQTLDEIIEMMNMLNSENPRDHPIGLYIENKEYEFYLENYDIDVAQITYDKLAKYNIETVEKATSAGLPIIIQSFETNALEKMASLTDLPLVQLMHYSSTWDDYDFDYISQLCHGVGPDSKWVMYWPHLSFEKLRFNPSTRSAFIDKMHELKLAVHPWTMRDDHLVYMDSAIKETLLYITKGVDGLFTEFPHTTLELFEEHGSEANFPVESPTTFLM